MKRVELVNDKNCIIRNNSLKAIFFNLKNKKNIDIIIPKLVTSINNEVFKKAVCSEITLPENITNINEQAFAYCKKLIKINLNEGLKVIGKNAFYSSAIKEITLPESVTIVDKNAFAYCKDLTKVYFNEGLKEISSNSFYSSAIKEITLPKDVTIVDSFAFGDCKKLIEINLNEGLKEIGMYSFANFAGKEIRLPKSLNFIGDNAFGFCKNLIKVNFNEGLKKIGDYSFALSAIEKIDLPNSVIKLGEGAFSDCKKLTQVNLKEGLKKIGMNAFYSSAVEKIDLPKSLTILGEGAFSDCKKLTKLNLNEGLVEIGMNAFKASLVEEINLPKSLIILGEGAFYDCKRLIKVNLNEGLKEIGDNAFKASSLKCLQIPKSVTKLKCNAFEGVDNFKINIYPDIVVNSNEFKEIKEIKGVKYVITSESIYKFENDTDYLKVNKSEIREKVINYELLENTNQEYLYFKWLDVVKNSNNKLKAITILALERNNDDTLLNKYLNSNSKLFNRCVKKVLGSVVPDSKDQIGLKDFYNFAFALGCLEKDEQIRTKANNFLLNKMINKGYNLEKFHKVFDNFKFTGFNKDFSDIFLNNKYQTSRLYDKVIEKNQKVYTYSFFDIYKSIKELKKCSAGKVLSLEMLDANFSKNKLGDVESEQNNDILQEFGKWSRIKRRHLKEAEQIRTKQIKDKIVQNLFDEADKQLEYLENGLINTASSLLNVADKEFKFEWLNKYDPLNFTMAYYLNCCSRFDGVGENIMKQSILENKLQNLVIKRQGAIVAKITFYVNEKENYMIGNTVVGNNRILNTPQKQVIVFEEIKKGVKAFVQTYNKKHPNKNIKRVNVGATHADIKQAFKPIDFANKKAKGFYFKCYGCAEANSRQIKLYDENTLSQ